jgi:hypothetical protein
MDEVKVIKSEIMSSLSVNYNYPMIEDIEIYKENGYSLKEPSYKVTLKLKDSFEFVFDNGYKSSEIDYVYSRVSMRHGLELFLMSVVNEFNQKLYKAQLKDLFLYRDKNNMSNEEYNKNYSLFAKRLFNKDIKELTKKEGSIVFGYSTLVKYNDSDEIVEDFNNFYKENGRFPYRNERLFKVYEYARNTGFINEENIDKINKLASSYSFSKLLDFVEKNKRWPYETEKEYVRTWNEVAYNFKNGYYDEEQLIKLDVLYAKYNNDNDSFGERLVNSFVSGLGYNVEKEKTFPDLVYKSKLRFDTCVDADGQMLLIEFDGPQHFIPIDFFGGEEGLKETKIRDQIKNDYCKKNNIPLLRISYKDIKSMEEMILDFIYDNIYKKKRVM